MQSNEIISTPQRVFVGIDVHLNSWDVTCLCGKYFKKSFTQPPVPNNLKTKIAPGLAPVSLALWCGGSASENLQIMEEMRHWGQDIL